jgi:outer membrane biosynthesis protein TonB
MNTLHSIFIALWNETKSLSPLVPLMLVSLLLALLLGGGDDLVGASSLFQSPLPSPSREEPTATPPPPVPPEPTATPVPTETPLPPLEPIATPLPPEATAAAPAETSEAPSEGSPSAPAETPVPPAEALDEAPEAAEPTPETLEESEEASPTESPSLIFNWGVFLNTVIVTLSYAWICCGVCGLVGTPLAFILFYVGGKRRLRQKLEESEETEQTPGADQTE